MYMTTLLSLFITNSAFSCLKRPKLVNFLGTLSGLIGSISTMYPNLLVSLGLIEISKRSS